MYPNCLYSILAAVAVCLSAAAETNPPPNPRPFVSPMFGDNMVLQRGKPDAIWGWSNPGDTVRVEIAGPSGENRRGRRRTLAGENRAAAAGRALHREN